MPHPRRFVPLLERLRVTHPELPDPERRIREGAVIVDGVVITNPGSSIARGASVRLGPDGSLRGERKLAEALAVYPVDVTGAIAVDVGAAAGGFTKALLAAGADRVYAVDVGFGQLLGSLRQDDRVVVLERTNLADLNTEIVPDPVDIVTADLSYVSLAAAVPQLESLAIRPHAHLIALIKPMFELGLADLPPQDVLTDAIAHAVRGVTASGWFVRGVMPSEVGGRSGAKEFFVRATRSRNATTYARPRGGGSSRP